MSSICEDSRKTTHWTLAGSVLHATSWRNSAIDPLRVHSNLDGGLAVKWRSRNCWNSHRKLQPRHWPAMANRLQDWCPWPARQMNINEHEVLTRLQRDLSTYRAWREPMQIKPFTCSIQTIQHQVLRSWGSHHIKVGICCLRATRLRTAQSCRCSQAHEATSALQLDVSLASQDEVNQPATTPQTRKMGNCW